MTPPIITTTTQPVVVPQPTTTTTQAVIVTTTSPPVDTRREVPYVVGLDYSAGSDRIQQAGFSFVRNIVDCGGARESSIINAQSKTGLQEPNTLVVLDVCQ